jgi:UDP-N-acetylmuramoyl-tripeptide--D-alanyl-D-alanine ligase
MRLLSTNEIRQAIHGRWLAPSADVTVEGVTIDSRTAKPGDLFVAIRGESHDGHDHLEAAAEAGCIAAIVNRDLEMTDARLRLFGGGLMGVEDTRKALGELAGHYRRHLPASVIAVTGSNGKTTVKRMIHHILSQRLTGQASPKSFNNDIGVPLTLLSVEPNDDYVICEIGTNAVGEVLDLSRIAQPDVAVITQVSEAHLEGLGSIDRVAVEKASLLAPLGSDGIAIVRGDNEPLARALASYESRMIRFGAGDVCQLRLTGYELAEMGQRFQINDRTWVDLPLLGRHNAMNALAAIAVAQRFGFSQDDAAGALVDFSGVEMRLEPIDIGPVRVINDAYNANPASMVAAIEVVCDLPAHRRVLVLGDMRELGPKEEMFHRELGQLIATGPADIVIGVGELGALIAEQASVGGAQTATYKTAGDIGTHLADMLEPGDLVLLKGSRSMGLDTLLGPLRAVLADGEKE